MVDRVLGLLRLIPSWHPPTEYGLIVANHRPAVIRGHFVQLPIWLALSDSYRIGWLGSALRLTYVSRPLQRRTCTSMTACTWQKRRKEEPGRLEQLRENWHSVYTARLHSRHLSAVFSRMLADAKFQDLASFPYLADANWPDIRAFHMPVVLIG